MINNYEIVYIVREDVKDLNSIQKEVEELVGGKVTKHELWETREFAYPIKKETKGHYMILHVETEGRNIVEFNLKTKFIKGILRYLVINLNEEKTFKIHKRTRPFLNKFKKENSDFKKENIE